MIDFKKLKFLNFQCSFEIYMEKVYFSYIHQLILCINGTVMTICKLNYVCIRIYLYLVNQAKDHNSYAYILFGI